jgi:hypothetical protein
VIEEKGVCSRPPRKAERADRGCHTLFFMSEFSREILHKPGAFILKRPICPAFP